MILSDKQIDVLLWWHKSGKSSHYDGIICDGAVRSGKSVAMSLGFILWAMNNFDDTDFAICGKTISSVKRNVAVPLINRLNAFHIRCNGTLSRNLFCVNMNGRTNRFHLFGGKDESSSSLIQGMTLGGVLFDEVALMPESFVNQALARCSVEKAKFWFNCNPENPAHWFHTNWIKMKEQKNMYYLHFTMDDNPTLSPQTKKRYENLYTGTFYSRFILGKWVSTQGLVYPQAAKGKYTIQPPPGRAEKYVISVDYGTINPFSAGLWGKFGDVWHRIDEFYFNSKLEDRQMTDEEYYDALLELAAGRTISCIVVDPSAASFIQTIVNHGRFEVKKANNDVLYGIRKVQSAMNEGKIKISPQCKDCINEFSLYRWDEGANSDKVIKQNDHAMDELRYFVMTILPQDESSFIFGAIERKEDDLSTSF